jgi:hypothetical protein
MTANQLKGMATGAIFMSIFGALWLLFGMQALDVLDTGRGVLTISAALLMLGSAAWVMRAARRFPEEPTDPAVGRLFGWINAVQWGACFAYYWVLAWLHREEYFVTGIALVVGLHFLPLARLFRRPASYATGGIMVCWTLAALAYAPAKYLQGVTAIGAGAILWQATATALAVAIAEARKPVNPSAPLSSPAPAA